MISDVFYSLRRSLALDKLKYASIVGYEGALDLSHNCYDVCHKGQVILHEI